MRVIAGETEELGEKLPQRHFVPLQIPHDQVRLRTPDRSGGKPTTNRLSYGAACKNLASSKIHRISIECYYRSVIGAEPLGCVYLSL
jgi:hypothetical protein